MIKPIKKDEELLAEIKAYAEEVEGLRIWWLGQSGFLIQWHGIHLLLDPYLSDSLSKKYQDTEKPHVRISELVISPEKLDFIDLVTSSHNHTDHLDAETLKPILKANPKIRFVIPEANRAFVAERVGCDLNFPIGLTDRQSYFLNQAVAINAIPSAHNELEVNENGHHKFLGYVIQIGPYSIYHSGDTLWYEGLEKKVAHFQPDVLLLPINGNKPERKVAGNMSAEEAAAFGKAAGSGIVIPHHYNMFEFNTEDPERFIEAAEREGIPYQVLEIGGKLEV
ncbi:MAG: MBL fold metallo-hydrolase [Algoriphagus sp.]|uniref:MBL fold metallo-hydrolase n=1 Tax=Algoriphagus sp. TaxID=1872435 RepID=UPI00260D9AC1|nr:MBL fold metallo-hydrolase [Algoriphagus sp.]MDG1277772.1 MBL fold metallo-hydrolase [Algoriphagus sp.]